MFFKYYSISWNLNRCVFSRVTYRYQWRGWFDRYSSFSSKRCYEDHTVPWWGKTSFTKNVILWKTFTNGGVYSLRIPQWYEGLHDDMKTNHSMIWRTIRAYNDMKDHTMIWRTIQWYESPYTIHHTHTTWDRFWQWRYFFSSSPSMFFFCLKSKHRQNFTSYWSNWLLSL